jgi:hypothetical protein
MQRTWLRYRHAAHRAICKATQACNRHAHARTHARKHTRTYPPAYIHTHIHNTYKPTYVHAYIHTYKHTYVHTYIQAYRTYKASVRQQSTMSTMQHATRQPPSMQLRSSRAKSFKTKPRTLCFVLRFRRPPSMNHNRLPPVGVWARLHGGCCVRHAARRRARQRAVATSNLSAPIGACAVAAALRRSVVGPLRPPSSHAPQTNAQKQSSFGRPPAPCRRQTRGRATRPARDDHAGSLWGTSVVLCGTLRYSAVLCGTLWYSVVL